MKNEQHVGETISLLIYLSDFWEVDEDDEMAENMMIVSGKNVTTVKTYCRKLIRWHFLVCRATTCSSSVVWKSWTDSRRCRRWGSRSCKVRFFMRSLLRPQTYVTGSMRLFGGAIKQDWVLSVSWSAAWNCNFFLSTWEMVSVNSQMLHKVNDMCES